MAAEAVEEDGPAVRLAEVVKAVAETDLAGLGQLASSEVVQQYIDSAGEGLQTRAKEVLKAYGWLGEVPAGKKLQAMVTWPIEKAEEARRRVLEEWESVWGKLPQLAQQHLDAASFKTNFLLDAGFVLTQNLLEAGKESTESPAKRRREDAGLSPASGSGGYQTIEEILQNGRSTNRIKCWVLAATGAPQARKTTRGKASTIYSVLVSDGRKDAVITSWGEAAKALHDGVATREGELVALTPVGASARSSRMGLPELMGGRGLAIEVVGGGDQPPAPSYLPLQQLPECADWAAVNVAGRVLEVMPGGGFKLVDDSGVAVRVHTDAAGSTPVQEGQKVELLLATKSTRFSNVSVSSFTGLRLGEKLDPEAVPLPARVVFAL